MNLLVIFVYIKIFTGINASCMVGGGGKEGMKGRREGGREEKREREKEQGRKQIFILFSLQAL